MNVVADAPPAPDQHGAKEQARAAANNSTLSADRPFPGLRPFAFADRDFFFGRESQAFALYRLVDASQFIAVVGGSGSGKSSLVRAGLCDLLDQESSDPLGPSWVWRDMRPGGSPIRRLAETLARISAREEADVVRLRDRIDARLRQSSFSLESALKEAGRLGGQRLLLIVDQFEELFRFGLAGLGLRNAGVAEARARDEATLFVQILLDARRVPDVHVLITMRSDFIGDCAFFCGLPEAVSATQYLVPGLTRMQLEDVIRRPIEKAGGSIEPELIERLLNDCSQEFDQLPVLQHCLMRMWDRGGGTSADGLRRLTRQTYDDIGRMKETLSRHADEVLRQCAGKELAVEQAFRALSEFDREGRAIRRPLRFDKLVAETGVAEAELRAVLDKFRAPSCSFLVPPPSVAQILAQDDRVDIGHEALLRRWKKLAGETEQVETTTGRPPDGWLAKEQLDGQRYRTLASLLEGGPSGEMATLNDPERVKLWWDARPRTSDWADRYGGKFEGVKTLIDDNISAKRRARHNRRVARAAVVGAVLVAVGAFGFWWRESSIREAEYNLRAEAKAASQLICDFLDAYHKGKITERGALSLKPMIDNFTGKVRGHLSPLEAGKLWVAGLNAQAELLMASDTSDSTPRMAAEARKNAQALVQRYPADPEAQQMLFESLMRIGDILAARPDSRDTIGEAVVDFRQALETATTLNALDARLPSFDARERATDDAVKAYLSLGDAYLRRSPPSPKDALEEYRKARETAKGMENFYPNDEDLRRDRAAASFRTGEVLADLGSWDEANEALNEAEKIQIDLISDNVNVKWDLSDTYLAFGGIIAQIVSPKAALDQYKKAVQLREELLESDSGSIRNRKRLAADYDRILSVIEAVNLSRDDSTWKYFRNQIDNLKQLAEKDYAARDEWLAKLWIALKHRGDLVDVQKFAGAQKFKLRNYAEALEAWSQLATSSKGVQLLWSRFDDHIQMADAFADASPPDWRRAAAAYEAAATIARVNLADDPSNPVWRANAETAALQAARAISRSASDTQ